MTNPVYSYRSRSGGSGFHPNMHFVPPQQKEKQGQSQSADGNDDNSSIDSRPDMLPQGPDTASSTRASSGSRGRNHVRVGYEENQQRKTLDLLPPDALSRTVHIVGLDGTVEESIFAAILEVCGVVSNAKICGDPRGRTLYGFIEFETREGAEKFVLKSGMRVGTTNLTVSFARSPIRTEIAGTKKVFDITRNTPMVQSAAYCPETVPNVGSKKGLPAASFGNRAYQGRGAAAAAAGYGQYAADAGYGASWNPRQQQQQQQQYQLQQLQQLQHLQQLQQQQQQAAHQAYPGQSPLGNVQSSLQVLQAAQMARLQQTLQAAQAAQSAQTWANSPAMQLEYYNQQVKAAYENAGISYQNAASTTAAAPTASAYTTTGKRGLELDSLSSASSERRHRKRHKKDKKDKKRKSHRKRRGSSSE
ncbi:Polyadenylate-binding protein-interacting protein 10 [Diplonema papillatum]|nr:Polyadenylate-binding protein-interacting protein 10 [Diplonema papillatum]